VALHIAARGFLPGYEAPWIAEIRRRLEDVLVRSHECVAASGLGLGGPELAAAERSARRVTELAPYRERGYRFLMQALAARDSVGEALLVYEQLRKVLRDELGASPAAATQALQRQLLKGPGLQA
jgi:DNA-binding SARP family transcriptional activator